MYQKIKINTQFAHIYHEWESILLSDDIQAIFILQDTKKHLDNVKNLFFDVFQHYKSLLTLGNAYEVFPKILEDLNQEIPKICPEISVDTSSLFVGILAGNELFFSVYGKHISVILSDEHIITNLLGATPNTNNDVFWLVSSWTLKNDDVVYVSNHDLYTSFTHDDIAEITRYYHDTNTITLLESLFEKEGVTDPACIHCIAPKDEIFTGSKLQGYKIKCKKAIKDIAQTPTFQKCTRKIHQYCHPKTKQGKIILFLVSISIVITLLYGSIQSILTKQEELYQPEIEKQRLVEATENIQTASQMLQTDEFGNINNPEIFREKIENAKNIVFDIRSKNIYLSEVQSLLQLISSLEQKFEKITLLELTDTKPLFQFSEDDVEVIDIANINRKQHFITTKAIYGPYVPGAIPTQYTYPNNEIALYSAYGENGKIYVYTKDNTLIEFSNGKFKYIQNSREQKWPKTNNISSYANNIYLLSEDAQSINKYSPLRGDFTNFSEAKNLISTSNQTSTIHDFAIDGGVYILNSDLSIDKLFTKPEERRSIILNKLPDNYKNSAESKPQIIAGVDLTNVYMLLNGNFVVFEANTRRYQDVTSLTYRGQIEINEAPITSVFVPKDGQAIFATKDGIYSISFEIEDDHISIL